MAAAALAIATPPVHVVVNVRGSSASLLSASCFIKIRQRVVGGGTTT